MKKIFLLTISSLIFINLFAATALAFNCEDVSTSKEGFFTIIEEPLITKKQETEDNKICFRECKAENEKRVCEIKSSCSPEPDSGTTCQRIQIIKSESGTGLLYTYVGMIYKWAAGTVGIISEFVLVFSGVGVITAGGDSGAIENHKKRIMQSLFGLVVLFLSGLILYTINPTFFV